MTDIAQFNIRTDKQAEWNEGLANNSDPYGRACYVYAARWASLMDPLVSDGVALADCAERTSHVADTDGITGFMYGCAVSILSAVWAHGEALRQWHNLKTQLRNEGELANATGGVLNPACLRIG